jgi:hypothetical protein
MGPTIPLLRKDSKSKPRKKTKKGETDSLIQCDDLSMGQRESMKVDIIYMTLLTHKSACTIPSTTSCTVEKMRRRKCGRNGGTYMPTVIS